MSLPKIVDVALLGGYVMVGVEWGAVMYNYTVDADMFGGEKIVGVENDEEPLFFTVKFADGKNKTVAMFLPDEEPFIDFYDFDNITDLNGEDINFTMMYS